MRRSWTAFAFLALLIGGSASAAPVLVTTRTALGTEDFIGWSQLGPDGDTVALPAAVTSDGGMGVQVASASNPSGHFERADEGSIWFGNFALNAPLLWTSADANGPMSIVFSTPVAGGGAQIQSDAYGAFTARIEAFDIANNSLGAFTLAGNSTNSEDDSAIFIGILNQVANISRIELGVPAANFSPQDFAINQFDMRLTGASPVPLPPTLPLFASAAACLALLRRKGRRT